MQPRISVDGFRLSVSSAPSCSNQGNTGGPDDIESLGDVYVWGELWHDAGLTDALGNPQSTKIDVLTPKPLESTVVLDVQQIACGVRHIALVTRQGEVFTWGEEYGGRLGHGIETDFTRPHLIEFLAVTNIEFVACGEHHSSAVSTSGDLFTWGDGVHHVGLLGHGTDSSHWIPKRVSGPLEGVQILLISCGTWHSALITSNGKLFTFGDGTFGILGHGDRESVLCPKEVQQLSGLKTIKVACGVWHTVAVVEVMSPSASGSNISSRKLFTWGDGDKYRLGHGNKDTYLLPTCVSALIDYNFHQIACGHNHTVALTTSGHVFTMGSSSNGQLGNPSSDGKVPCLVQDKLVGEYVEEISSGANHVAVLTSRSEVYTWGKGANGRLGHGDLDDRKTPTLVEGLKERLVKSLACGSNFTAVIGIHKWVSGADQSVCSGCRQAFGFTRKRHNCYNCGLVHCHACSSKKAVRAALAPTPSKPHRVCDACYNKLKAATTTGSSSQQFSKKPTTVAPRRSIDSSTKERTDRTELKSSRLLLSPITEPVKYLEVKSQRHGGKSDSFSMVRASQVPAFQQLKDVAFPSSFSSIQSALRPTTPPPPPAPPFPGTLPTWPSSSYARKASSPRSGPPVFSRGVLDSLRKSNEVLSQEVSKLQKHIKTLKEKSDVQEEEIQKLQKNAREASSFGREQSSNYKDTKEVVKTFIDQLKEMVEKFSYEAGQSDSNNLEALQTQILSFIEALETGASSSSETSLLTVSKSNQEDSKTENHQSNEQSSTKGHKVISLEDESVNQDSNEAPSSSDNTERTTKCNLEDESVKQDSNEASSSDTTERATKCNLEDEIKDSSGSNLSNETESSTSQGLDGKRGVQEANSRSDEPTQNQDKVHEASRTSQSSSRGDGSRESIEQFEHGVYVTFIKLRNGTKVFRRVRFSKRRFAETQAEEWWKKNRERVLQKYIPPPPSNPSATTNHAPSQTTSLTPPSSSEKESNTTNEAPSNS